MRRSRPRVSRARATVTVVTTAARDRYRATGVEESYSLRSSTAMIGARAPATIEAS
ncbi:hypothetical protein SMD44_07549 [Streptomyces alboflavus]|uniref:Uncharacterized protein n=1 Tax=Streptomyces alboflavus TaxID=67267 RepID=A0A1Z1WP40_9ACTN|nr:hypothetical protein SMD44_07549 [Streptomyces alboflavus]